ncbi:hypothetical protein KSP39_PZI020139 [Platanthera zijinensis]|uniref:Uncharacterized protein n=1 Tax=Platanthera zijinensis TaxID=2320716 RepID=A0AAP0B000_9ASPA
MTSSHHAPYALGDTRATMAGTKGRDPARGPPYSIVTAVEFHHQVRDGLVWFLYA